MITGQTIRLRVGAARRDCVEEFPLPAGWDARVYPPRDRRAMTQDEVSKALDNPAGSPTIAQAARGARSAVILVDDFRRPTPAEFLCNAVIDRLESAGLKRDQIAIILGNGAHRVMTRAEVRKRLGSALERVAKAISHDAYSSRVRYLGLTSLGTPVLANEDAASADFSVSISCVYPHPFVAWGGGAKMVLPGICHVSTLHYHHGRIKGTPRATSPGACPARKDIEEAAELFGLDFSLCAVVNSDKELCGLGAGSPRKSHQRGVAIARKVGDTPVPQVAHDLVIANAYPLDADGTQWSKGLMPAKHFGCPVLLINDFADPSTYHGLYDGPVGPYRKRPRDTAPALTPELRAKADVFMYSPQYGDGFIPPDRSWFGHSDWESLMDGMLPRFPEAKVAVLPVSPLQLPRWV